jgi:cyclic-di-GMP-binding protein
MAQEDSKTEGYNLYMPGEFSFDVVSEFDRQELANAIDQAHREISTRYDLKDSGSTIELEKDTIALHSANEMSLKAVGEVLIGKVVRRGLSSKILDFGKIEDAAKGTVRQTITLRKGLNQELTKEITKLVREELPKLKTQIQGDAVRITGKSKNDLQAAIRVVKTAEEERKWPVPLQFTNYR